jgi:formate dehydrogenase iron-sulfur subunit
MDKCTFCAGGPLPDNSSEEYRKYGSNRIAQGKLPLCAEMCATKALLAGDADMVSEIYRKRVVNRAQAALGKGFQLRQKNLGGGADLKGKVTN